MLLKLSKPTNNTLECVDMMLKGAKKRRRLASCAINAMNSQLGFEPNIVVVK